MACGDFESEVGNGMKAGLAGIAVGALAWLLLEATKTSRHQAAADAARQRAAEKRDEAKRKREGW